jgi:protein-tyrosine phosphatase
MIGRIDIHSHLLPGVDDGCQSVPESLECARRLVAAGYTHSFCTPHVTPHRSIGTDWIRAWTAELQSYLDEADIALHLLPGGEITIRPELLSAPANHIVTCGMVGKYVLVDLWADVLPDYFSKVIQGFQSQGLKVILAHPERMVAVQANPGLAEAMLRMGVLLQGNLQCLADSSPLPTRICAEKFLREKLYFVLATDLHGAESLGHRLQGLVNAIEMVGSAEVDRLTRDNPRMLLPPNVVDMD